jgi:small-conductance mechanosensitive channel
MPLYGAFLRIKVTEVACEIDVIVPNTDLTTTQVTNWALADRHTRGIIPVGVAYGSDVPRVAQTLKECALAHPGIARASDQRCFGLRRNSNVLRAGVRTVPPDFREPVFH